MDNKNFADPVTALKSQRELEKMIGTDRMAPPGKDEDITKWNGWDKIGVPKEAAQFKDAIKLPENLPEGMVIDQGLLDKAFAIAAEKRVHPAHLQEMVNLFAEHQVEGFKAAAEIDAADRRELAALYDKWGSEKDANLELAKRAGKALGFGDDLIGETSELIGSSKLIAHLAKMGKQMAEGGFIQGSGPAISPQQAKAELDAMKADPEIRAIIMDSSHPRHKIEKERFEKLSLASLTDA